MRVLKVTGICILILIAIVIILGIIAPKDYTMERTATIKCPKFMVFDQVRFWRNWTSWSPWVEKDSTMIVTVEGTDGEAGSVYRWEGNPKISGTGFITNTGIKELEEISYHLNVMKPRKNESDRYIRVSGENDSTLVTWGEYSRNPFPCNVLALFMNMNATMGKDFDRGLELLKKLCEANYEKVLGYEIKETYFPKTNYAAIRKVVEYAELEKFFGSSYTTIFTELMKQGKNPIGPPAGIYYDFDPATWTGDTAAAIPILGQYESEEISMITIPAGKAYVLDMYGPYNDLQHAHSAFALFIKKENLKFTGPSLEVYVTDMMEEPDPGKWLTKIYYFLE